MGSVNAVHECLRRPPVQIGHHTGCQASGYSLTAGVSVSWPDDGPVRIHEPEIAIGGLRIQLREHDFGAVGGEDRAGLRLRERIRRLVKVRPIGS